MIVTAGKSTLINNFLQLEGDAVFVARLDPNSVTHTEIVRQGDQWCSGTCD